MDSEALNRIKAELDNALKGVRPWMGILFGEELFNEFRTRGWITLETFGLSTFGFDDPMPAYDKTHFASATWGIPDYEYRIGKDPKGP